MRQNRWTWRRTTQRPMAITTPRRTTANPLYGMERCYPPLLRQIRRAILIQTGSRRQTKRAAVRPAATVSNSHYLKNLGFLILVFVRNSSRHLHLLVHMGAVENIGALHSLTIALDFGRLVVNLRAKIPQLEDMKALLGADGDTDDSVLGIGGHYL